MSEVLSTLDSDIDFLSDDDDDKQYLEVNPAAETAIVALSDETLKIRAALMSGTSWASLAEELEIGDDMELPIPSIELGPSRSLASDDIESIPEA